MNQLPIQDSDIPTILIVDDKPSNLAIVVESLEQHDFRAIVARDGKEGLQRAELVKPDLILLDVMMPKLDGFEVCQRLKANANTRDIPVIFMTALEEVEYKIAGFKAGAVDYLTKPLQTEEVIARVETHLKLRAMQKQLEKQNLQSQKHREELEQRVAERTAELRESNRQLREREQQFRTLAENSPDVIVRYDRECRRVYYNRSYLKIGPAGAAATLAQTPMESWWLASPSPEEYTARLQHTIKTGKPDELLVEVELEGLPAYYRVSMVPEFDDSKQVVSVLAIGHDITGIKRMEAMLRKSELEFRTLAENSPEMIVRYDLECRRVYINPAYEQQTGIPIQDAWNRTPAEAWKPLMPYAEYMARLKHVMATGEHEHILLEWHQADGSFVSHLMHVVAEYDEEGCIAGALAIGHNISELKATERRLEESRMQLRAMTAQREAAREEERKSIAREIHDELGQLLNVLRLNVTTLDYRFGEDIPDLRATAGRMVGTVDRAIMMVRSLATRLRPAALSSGICSALEWMVQEFSETTGIVCELSCHNDEIPLDEDRAMVVFRIVQESLTNVLRHSGAEHVGISVFVEDDSYKVEVHDNGKGFDPASSGRRNSFGIVGMRERALMLGGDLEIISEPGQGTRLRLRIPIVDGLEKI